MVHSSLKDNKGSHTNLLACYAALIVAAILYAKLIPPKDVCYWAGGGQRATTLPPNTSWLY